MLDREKSARLRPKDILGVVLPILFTAAIAIVVLRDFQGLSRHARTGEVVELGGPLARALFSPALGHLTMRTLDGRSELDVELSLVVDGAERPFRVPESDIELQQGRWSATFPIPIGDEHSVGFLELKMDSSSSLSQGLAISLVVTPDGRSVAHSYALSLGMAPGSRAVFVPGTGLLSDLGDVTARAVVLDDDVHPFAMASADPTQAMPKISLRAPDVDEAGARPRLVVSSSTENAPEAHEKGAGAAARPVRLNLSLLVGSSSQAIWGPVYSLLHVDTALVSGMVTGARTRTRVVARDDHGRPNVRASTDEKGRFRIDTPKTATSFSAELDSGAQSPPIRFLPGAPGDLTLDVSPPGELRARVVDVDTKEPIVARLLVKGIDGTIDPNFGPDYRASGAGPLMDVLGGPVTTPLPVGHYRVAATHGIEWSIDAQTIEITSNQTTDVELELRHVVPTPGMVGCDLHVHASPSFDSPVTPEDRVLSLVAAGIDFAVPSEHNIVGDYGPAARYLNMGRQFSFVTGVEVTTESPSIGHFGVFPYPLGLEVPPFVGTTASAVFSAARRGEPNGIVQVNHPRMQMGIGYFEMAGFDPKSGHIPEGMQDNFDTLEVYNGYESHHIAEVLRVMEDWFALLNLGKHYAATGSSDSHRIQYQWAGYPRTFALIDPTAAGDTGLPIDTREVVAAVKKGRSFVSSGPVIELSLRTAGKTATPGDELPLPHGKLLGKLRVRAAPWVDVTSVDLVAGISTPAPGITQGIFHETVPSRPTFLGKEEGTREESAQRAIRFEADLDVVLPENAHWIVAIVRGDRPLDDALPFMPIQPLAFTNPIWFTGVSAVNP
ncbi:MAG: CehA/McbA family metallohydrolase [Polyangiaceae bacterium]|nr:CehA/McbA family metallohydrolase [Polyangiaceae bacterium]